MTRSDQLLGPWLKRFLLEYAGTERNLSRNTIRSYRDTFRLLIPKLTAASGRSAENLLLSDITEGSVIDFLDSIERDRACSARTRNQRLASICAFAKYVSMHSPEHVEWCGILKSIPQKKSQKRLVTYLEKDEMNALLEAPNRNTVRGFCDYAMLLFLYNTGARAEEASSVLVKDVSYPINGTDTAMVTMTGKGRKTRRCPLWRTTCKVLKTITGNRDLGEHLFLNCRGKPITRFGIYEMVARHSKAAAEKHPSIGEKRPSPHTIRHTTATHLLQAGVDINTIRAWLGHVSVNTTNIYAEVNMQMKALALEKCELSDGGGRPKVHWRDNKKLMDFLDGL